MTTPTKPNRRPEAKAVAATGAAGFSGGAAILFVLWLLGTQVWDAPSDAVHANAAIAAVPFPVNALVGAGVTALLTYAAAWLAPHTHRPDLAAEVPAASHLDERIATPLEHIDALVTEKWEHDKADTGPMPAVRAVPAPGFLDSVMDEAHD